MHVNAYACIRMRGMRIPLAGAAHPRVRTMGREGEGPGTWDIYTYIHVSTYINVCEQCNITPIYTHMISLSLSLSLHICIYTWVHWQRGSERDLFLRYDMVHNFCIRLRKHLIFLEYCLHGEVLMTAWRPACEHHDECTGNVQKRHRQSVRGNFLHDLFSLCTNVMSAHSLDGLLSVSSLSCTCLCSVPSG